MKKQAPVTLVWFRSDLRLDDHPALDRAVRREGSVVPVFVLDEGEDPLWPRGAASRWWLHHSLAALDERLRSRGSRLILRQGPTLEVLRGLCRELHVLAVEAHASTEPAGRALEARLGEVLAADGIELCLSRPNLLLAPGSVVNSTGGPYRVFTPYWRSCLKALTEVTAVKEPRAWKSPRTWPTSPPLEALELLPRGHWAQAFPTWGTPGEAGAQARWKAFLRSGFESYGVQRDDPGRSGTSRLSPYLQFGEISPRRLWCDLNKEATRRGWASGHWMKSTFVTQLGWREFAHHLLWHFPDTCSQPLRKEFEDFPWRTDAAHLQAWQRGQTGYPLVDAGMRELWATGWMHNRTRMVVGSFLVKHLRIHWLEGARWFWDTLVDADWANNTLGWQWVSGCGADAAPYFRIFNPVAQGQRFDPGGDYVRRWVPELASLAPRWIHQPFAAPSRELERSGIILGRDYPQPLVPHALAREAALDAYRCMKQRHA